jgi:hypothetical protein
MATLQAVTERLCDLMLDEPDLSLKDILMERLSKQLNVCFVHASAMSHSSPSSSSSSSSSHLYAKPDEAELLHHSSSFDSSTPRESSSSESK